MLIAFGGGDMAPRTRLKIDKIFRERLSAKLRVGYVAWANSDSMDGLNRFLDAFEIEVESITEISASSPACEVHKSVSDLDMIYIGDGNPEVLTTLLRENGLDVVLKDASNGGTILCGVGAGASCMFEQYIHRSDGGEPCLTQGAALFGGVFASHGDSVQGRRTAMAEFVESHQIRSGVAVDDGTALIVEGQTIYGVSPGFAQRVRRIHRKNGRAVATLIDV